MCSFCQCSIIKKTTKYLLTEPKREKIIHCKTHHRIINITMVSFEFLCLILYSNSYVSYKKSLPPSNYCQPHILQILDKNPWISIYYDPPPPPPFYNHGSKCRRPPLIQSPL